MDEAFERFREYSIEQMGRFFSGMNEFRTRMEELRQQMQENERRNLEEHRQFRAELRAAVREGVRFVRETRREIQAINVSIDRLSEAQLVTEQKLQTFIDSLRQGGNGRS